MNTISRKISGSVCLLLGLILGYNSFIAEEGFWLLLIYGLVLVGVGIFILLNDKEDEIEQVKTDSLKTKQSKKSKIKEKILKNGK
jgi:uncharacterized membrane protein HdeD (DUF308 family)